MKDQRTAGCESEEAPSASPRIQVSDGRVVERGTYTDMMF